MGEKHLTRELLAGGSFFEAPRWHDERWWVSDFYRQIVLSVSVDGGDERVELRLEDQPSGLGWDTEGALLVVSMTQRQLLRRLGPDTVESVADLGHLFAGAANDMVVDSNGGAFVSNLGYDVMAGERPSATVLVRVDVDGSASFAAGDLRFPNGIAILGDTLVVAETTAARLTAFRMEPDGSLSNRRVWAQLDARVGPDGCCFDSESRVWVADAFGRGCSLVEEGGRIIDQVPSPWGMRTYACMLGGTRGRTLLQCCAPNFQSDLRRHARDAVLVATDVLVPRAGFP